MKYGLLGEKLGHSFSKILHEQIGNDSYELIEIEKDKVDRFLAEADFDGINVTIPYKETAMAYCENDEISADIGCVNTLHKKDGHIYGYNTDCLGFAYLASTIGIDWKGKKVVILGSGGTSKTASYVAYKSDASRITIVSRKATENATDSGWRSKCIHSTYENEGEWSDADIIVNTTPVGMYPNNEGMPVDLDVFSDPKAVLDVIYNPLETRLVLEAKKRGIPASCGLAMLVAQGWYSEQIWMKNDISLKIEDTISDEAKQEIDKITKSIKKQKQNIVLIGMPGSGKSTIGKAIAKELNREFVDTDEAFYKKYGITPEQCINENGVDDFREKESIVVKEEAASGGIILATGGGAVLREDNRMALSQNGFIVFLNRDPKKLATDGRPLSQQNGVMKLYEQRLPIYKSLMDIEVEVCDDYKDTLKRVLGMI